MENLIKNMKKLNSVGELVRVGNTHEIGMDHLCEICLRKAKLDKELELKCVKKLKAKFAILKAYIELKESKDRCNWVNGY